MWAPQLPELLSLTESHGLVGDGGGEARGPSWGEAESSGSLHSSGSAQQAAGDPRPKRRGNSTEEGSGHTGVSAASRLTFCGALATPWLLGPQFTHLWHVWVGHP